MAKGIRAWTYEADIHCQRCATARFGVAVTEWPWPDQTTTDREGNLPHPIFDYDEIPESGEYCGTCHVPISPPPDRRKAPR